MIYELAFTASAVVPPGSPIAEIVAAATHAPKLMELSFTWFVGSTTQLGLGRPQAKGVANPSTPGIPFVSHESPGNTSLSVMLTRWGTVPTVPLNFFRRATLNSATGAGVIWVFPRGVGIPAGGSLVLWNVSNNNTVEQQLNIVARVTE
jgi:hypothetical protein